MERPYKYGQEVEIVRGGSGWEENSGQIDTRPDLVGKRAVIKSDYSHVRPKKGLTFSYQIELLTGEKMAWFNHAQLKPITPVNPEQDGN